MSLSGERGTLSVTRFVQQSPVSLKCGEAERSTCSLGMRQIRRRRAEPTHRTSNLAEALLRRPLNVGLRRCGPAALIQADRRLGAGFR